MTLQLSSHDIPLVITIVIVLCLLMVFNVRFLYYYIDYEVTKYHVFTKFVYLLAMLFAECTILLFPLDIANRAGSVNCDPSLTDTSTTSSCGSFDIILAWQIIYGIIGSLLIIFIPFYIFFYETYDENMKQTMNDNATIVRNIYQRYCGCGNCKTAFKVALMYTLIIIAILIIILFICYSYVSRVHIPVQSVAIPFSLSSAWNNPFTSMISTSPTYCSSSSSSIPNTYLCVCGSLQCNWYNHEIIFHSTFIIYMATLLTFLGWFIFSIYSGIGFMALPLHLIQNFIYRPKLLSSAELRLQKQSLCNRSQELIKIGEDIAERIFMNHDQKFQQHQIQTKSKETVTKAEWLKTWTTSSSSSSSSASTKHSSSLVKGKATLDTETKYDIARLTFLVNALEKDTETLAFSDPQNFGKLYNPLWAYGKLILGIGSFCISILWILHIIIFLLFQPSLHPFLNKVFILLEQSSLSILPALCIAIFGIYLLLAASKGATVLGSRLFLLDIHPLVPHKTLLNSLFFHLGLVYLCILPTTQLLSDAFAQFGRASDATMIFGIQFRYTEGMLYFWRYNVFLFTILGFSILSIIYYSIFPSERRYVTQMYQTVKQRHQVIRSTIEKEIHRQGGTLKGLEMKSVLVK